MRALLVIAVVLGIILSGCTFFGAPEECGTERAYVCGSDGNTYTNACFARQVNVSVAYEGACAGNVTSAQCTDSDSGKNALEAGTTAKGEQVFNDSCATTGSVYEYYCVDNEIQSERVSCPEGTECSGGACITQQCRDSDNGQAADERGTTSRGDASSMDECLDSATLTEYYCSENRIASIALACTGGRTCLNGECVLLPCSDTDAGFNVYERGTVREDNATYTDYCSGTSSVREYYCSGDNMAQALASCGDGFYCSNGACLEYICRDTDGGRDEDEFGTVSKGSGEWEDECYDEDTVKEYYCDGNEAQSTRMDCSSTEVCEGGECVRITCSDTDGGNVRGTYGTVTAGSGRNSDSCTDLYYLTEYFCSGSRIMNTSIRCTDYSELCYGNECSPAYCEDSDGGRDKDTYGTARLWTENGYSYSESDSCTADGRSVREKYCSDLKINTQTIACGAEQVCSGDRCIEATCSDSDGGRNYIVPGIASKGTVSQPDSCDPMDPIDLYEYYCSGNEIVYEIRTCPDGCVEDADGVGYCNPL
ncbi:MAG: Kazal-type serine protease inhibitor family protein [Candidatus Micrarchaeota archaeon]